MPLMPRTLENENEVKVIVQIGVTISWLRCLLVSAFEGGSNYWYMIERAEFPEGVTEEDFCEGGRFTDPKNYFHPTQLIPFHPGCALIITDSEASKGDDNYKKEFRLDRPALEKGIQVMAEKYPHHFKSVMEENTDAITGDVYLQCCLFGDAIYG